VTSKLASPIVAINETLIVMILSASDDAGNTRCCVRPIFQNSTHVPGDFDKP